MMDDTYHGPRRGTANAEQRWLEASSSLAEARLRNREMNCPMFVEGKRDKIALERLGFQGPVEVLNRGWSVDDVLVHLVDTYGARHPLDGGITLYLLMDWDRTGGRIQRTCRRNLESLDVAFDEDVRRTLMRCLKPETVVVEGLLGLAEVLKPLIDQFDYEDSSTG